MAAANDMNDMNELAGMRAALRAFVLLLLLPALLVGCEEEAPAGPKTQKVTIKEKKYELELALTDSQRQQGLSDRKEIAEDGGMLFVFANPSVVNFVMRKCLVPIDILFLSPNGHIVAMHEMKMEPYNTPDSKLKGYSSVYLAQFAIEVKAGSIKALDLKEGDAIDLPLEELKKRAR
ncbi:MAG: DUF192 domain-containing protein [Phycisphaeraceae bacterium]